jgi:hypothetical protein
MTFAISSSGWLQHSLALQSDMDTAQLDIINIKGAVNQQVILTDYVVISTITGTWSAGTMYAAINGRQYTQKWDTNKDTSLTALAAQLEADDEVLTATYSAGAGTIVIVPDARKYLNVTTNVADVTGTLAITSAVGGTWVAGAISFSINSVNYKTSYVSTKANTMAALMVAMATNSDVASAVYDSTNNKITITPNAGKALYVVIDISAITGNMILNNVTVDGTDLVDEKNNLKLLTDNEDTFDAVFSTSYFTVEQTLPISYRIIKPLAAGSPITVILSYRDLEAAAAGTDMIATGTPIPIAIKPNSDLKIQTMVFNNSVYVSGYILIGTSGSLEFKIAVQVVDYFPDNYIAQHITQYEFIEGGNKGVLAATITYSVYPA